MAPVTGRAFSRALRARRRGRSLTQDALAALTKISQSRISLAERGLVILHSHERKQLQRVLGRFDE